MDPGEYNPRATSPRRAVVAFCRKSRTARSHRGEFARSELHFLVLGVVERSQCHRRRMQRASDLDLPRPGLDVFRVDGLVGADHREPDGTAEAVTIRCRSEIAAC